MSSKVYFHLSSEMLNEARVITRELQACIEELAERRGSTDPIQTSLHRRAEIFLTALSGINANPPADSECKKREWV